MTAPVQTQDIATMTDTNTVHGGAVEAARKRLAQYVEGESYTAWRGEAPAGEPTLKRDLKLVLCTPQIDTDAREKVVEASDRVAKFVLEWSKGRANGDEIYGLHPGDEREASLSLSDLRTILAALKTGDA